jgi:hypothetical protein
MLARQLTVQQPVLVGLFTAHTLQDDLCIVTIHPPGDDGRDLVQAASRHS